MSLPALAVVAFFSFTQAWSEFLYAQVFVSSNEVRTVTAGISDVHRRGRVLLGTDDGLGGPQRPAPVILYLVFQRWVVKGLTLGAVKG